MDPTTIVVGIDGSATADHALRWARTWAASRSAEVRAVMAWDVPAHLLAPPPYGLAVSSMEIVEDAARAIFDASIKRAEGGPGPLTTVLRHGRPADVVLADVEASDADLLVVGTRGLGPVRRALMGSVSTRLVVAAGCPVAVVPPGAPIGSDGPVVVGVDGSPGSHAALRWAADATDGPIHAVHVMEDTFKIPFSLDGVVFTDLEAIANAATERAVAEAIGDRPDVTVEVVSGDARDSLVQAADAVRASMVVVGARGEKGLAGVGSVATNVASHSDVAVVVVPVT